MYSLLQAGQTIIAGGRDKVQCFDAEDGKRLWNGEVEGQVRNMCIVSGRLIVSTTEGQIICFAPAESASPQAEINVGQRTAKPLPPAGHGGYCLVAGEYDLEALMDLAQSFDLVLYAMTDGDPAPLRSRLYQAGVYGTRVVVHRIDGPTMPYTDYFANEVRCVGHIER